MSPNTFIFFALSSQRGSIVVVTVHRALAAASLTEERHDAIRTKTVLGSTTRQLRRYEAIARIV